MLLVFFFKQKTAYEMRISDWSSDVCSSDLDLVERQLEGRLDAAQQETIIGPRCLVVEVEAAIELQQAAEFELEGLVRRLDGEALVRGRDRRRFPGAGAGVFLLDFELPFEHANAMIELLGTRRFLRWEEHTYELQSLKRI